MKTLLRSASACIFALSVAYAAVPAVVDVDGVARYEERTKLVCKPADSKDQCPKGTVPSHYEIETVTVFDCGFLGIKRLWGGCEI